MHSIDIMLPFWGEPAYLFETVQAVLSQDCTDWRLTVVDDCYPDPSVAEYFRNLADERISYLRNESNLGITANYEKCVSLATADLVMLLGCDDIPHPDFISRVLSMHDAFPAAAIIQPGVRIIDSTGSTVDPFVDRIKRLTMPCTRVPRLLSGEYLAASLLRADWLYWPSLVFKREALVSTPFREGFPIIQDLALIIDMIAAGEALLLDPYVCFSYRRHNESASATALFDGRRFDGEKRYFELAAKIAKRNGWSAAVRAAKLHSTSRAHAVALLPKAIRTKDTKAVKMLASHAFRS